MKYTLLIALFSLGVVSSCDTVTTAATDAAQDVADSEFKRHTGIDSVSTKISSLDTIKVEDVIKREVNREVKRQADKILR